MQVQPYLFFDGRCEEAVEFYRRARASVARRAAEEGHEAIVVACLGLHWPIEDTLIGRRDGDRYTSRRVCAADVSELAPR